MLTLKCQSTLFVPLTRSLELLVERVYDEHLERRFIHHTFQYVKPPQSVFRKGHPGETHSSPVLLAQTLWIFTQAFSTHFPYCSQTGIHPIQKESLWKTKEKQTTFSTRGTSGENKIKKNNNPHIKRRNRRKRIRCYLLVNTVIDLADLETIFEFTTNRVTM